MVRNRTDLESFMIFTSSPSKRSSERSDAQREVHLYDASEAENVACSLKIFFRPSGGSPQIGRSRRSWPGSGFAHLGSPSGSLGLFRRCCGEFLREGREFPARKQGSRFHEIQNQCDSGRPLSKDKQNAIPAMRLSGRQGRYGDGVRQITNTRGRNVSAFGRPYESPSRRRYAAVNTSLHKALRYCPYLVESQVRREQRASCSNQMLPNKMDLRRHKDSLNLHLFWFRLHQYVEEQSLRSGFSNKK